jgi:DNA modification methylase
LSADTKPSVELLSDGCSQWSGQHSKTGAEWFLHCGDACDVIARLQPDFYKCIITSPPYFWQRDYGITGQIGVEPKIESYVSAIADVMDAVKTVLNPRGVLLLNLGDTYYSGKGKPHGEDRKHNGRRFSGLRAVDKTGLGPPKKTLLGMPWRVALAMIDRDWILRSSIIWRRKNAVPEPNVKDRPWRSYENIFLFSKSRAYDFSREPFNGIGAEDVWTIESQSKAGREHPAVFPLKLVEKCLAIGNPKNGPVLDPFVGSGTVIRCALRLGMRADGIDLNPEFCRLAAKNLSAE